MRLVFLAIKTKAADVLVEHDGGGDIPLGTRNKPLQIEVSDS